MNIRWINTLVLLTSIALTSACESPNHAVRSGQYWQKVSVADAAYLQGPKAQQILNRDIARCVTELRELERLGTLRNTIPMDENGRVIDPDEKELKEWETPSHDDYLRAEHTEFHDFETCMRAKGWERVLHVPYDTAERARANYLKAHVDYEYQSRFVREKDKKRNDRKGYNN